MGKRHVAQRQPALLINDLEHGVDIAVVEHKKAPGIADGVAVLLQNGDAEAVEGVDVAGILVSGQVVDALAHFVRGLVRERHTQQISRQNAQLRHQIRKPPRQRPRLAGACARDHAHKALSRQNSLPLRRIQSLQQLHARPSLNTNKISKISYHIGDVLSMQTTGALWMHKPSKARRFFSIYHRQKRIIQRRRACIPVRRGFAALGMRAQDDTPVCSDGKCAERSVLTGQEDLDARHGKLRGSMGGLCICFAQQRPKRFQTDRIRGT